MTELNQVPLSAIVTSLESGGRPKGGIVDGEGEVFSLGGEHLDGKGGFDLSNGRFVSRIFYEQMKRGIVEPRDILIVKDGATTGKVSYIGESLPYSPCAINEHLFRLAVDHEKAEPVYVFYYLLSPQGNSEILLDFRGATVGGISQEFVHKVMVPLPPLTEQQRIAAILARADRLRRLRRYALDLSDTYLQSVFLEMFGDPVTNPMGWDVSPLRSISVKFQDGPFGSNLKTEHYTPSGVRVIRLQNIGVGELIDDDKAYITKEHFSRISKHKCVPGDVLVGTLGDPNLRACILPASIPVALNKADCVQIRVNVEQAKPEFICRLLNMPQTLFLATGMIHGQTRSRISMGQLAKLEVPIPPLSHQQQFAHIVHRFERLRAQQREAERQAEHLFQTLLHQAFWGKL